MITVDSNGNAQAGCSSTFCALTGTKCEPGYCAIATARRARVSPPEASVQHYRANALAGAVMFLAKVLVVLLVPFLVYCVVTNSALFDVLDAVFIPDAWH